MHPAGEIAVARAETAGYRVLMVTVDTTGTGRDRRPAGVLAAPAEKQINAAAPVSRYPEMVMEAATSSLL